MQKIRLFTKEQNLAKGLQIKVCDNDFDYLTKVMRKKNNDEIFIFNGLDGEFLARIFSVEKKYLMLEVVEKISPLKKVPNITLAFALLKNVKIDFIASKAAELGVARLQPIVTQHTIVDKINEERFFLNVKEALEQCERNDFCEILSLKKLDKFISEEETKEKILILCDESHQGFKASKLLPTINVKEKEIIVLIGPEGGFSKSEFEKMRALKNVYSLSLGSRILRADTAIISALTLVQEFLGDF